MASFNGQGQSDVTPSKEEGFGAMLRINLSIAKYSPALKDRLYFHFDLNCGKGWNSDLECPGSPMVFFEEADRVGKQVVGVFVDRDVESIKRLVTLQEVRRTNAFCVAGDNADFVQCIPHIIRSFGENPKYAIGTVLCDPNGTDIPFAGLASVFRQCPRLDVIINWNAIAIKRERGAKLALKRQPPPRIECLPKLFGKRYWHIRHKAGVHQFSILIGRNMKANDYKRLGFYCMDSPQGKSIVQDLDWSKRGADECPLSSLCRLPVPPCLSSYSRGGNGARRPALPHVRCECH